MADKKKRHPQTGLPMSDKPSQQRVVEQATEARDEVREMRQAREETDKKAAGKTLSTREQERTQSGSGAVDDVDVPDSD